MRVNLTEAQNQKEGKDQRWRRRKECVLPMKDEADNSFHLRVCFIAHLDWHNMEYAGSVAKVTAS